MGWNKEQLPDGMKQESYLMGWKKEQIPTALEQYTVV